MSEGAGVEVRRSIGTPTLRRLDPFLMLDHFSSDNPDDYLAGFPDHPHRGFVTLTYMLDGHMLHRDSMGNRRDLVSGGAQWMKAASGVIHSEMPQQSDGLMRGLQLWINLPAAQKITAPTYREITPAAIPTVELSGATARVLAGRVGDTQGPIDDPHAALLYFDITVPAGLTINLPIANALDGFVYLFEGLARVAEVDLPTHQLAALGAGDSIVFTAGPTRARFLLVAGRPIGEPIVQYGPFIMNTRTEIEQAFADYRDNRLVRARADIVGD
ncbi:MAG: pirin family protein [Thiotrichales bacterium]